MTWLPCLAMVVVGVFAGKLERTWIDWLDTDGVYRWPQIIVVIIEVASFLGCNCILGWVSDYMQINAMWSYAGWASGWVIHWARRNPSCLFVRKQRS